MPLSDVVGDPVVFLQRVAKALWRERFLQSEFRELDHIGYRTADVNSYRQICVALMPWVEVLREEPIDGHLVATMRLLYPVRYQGWAVHYLEVASPYGGWCVNSFDHASLVLNADAIDQFMARHPDINFDTQGLDRRPSPEVTVRHSGVLLEFHTMSVEQIVGTPEA